MKKNSVLFIATVFAALSTQAQKPINWTEKQLMEPAALATVLKENSKLPLIVSVGPGALIPNSVDIGPGSDEENIAAFGKLLSGKKKEEKIVVYCGCCPFAQCPNVRPAIQALKDGGFTNYYLLNIPKNLKTDWIDKGYPTVK
ncbi:rhodanese-like domain-containing protein [Paracnuella aquatica]|uniref:rhodanese-like domain-containing protein n=1 Tax=Paracnuella aquatica TaxID=2268757 RepID=UPI000DEF3D69|nr:rhodanese-like domain-containing protein [Paracnuella aquatica]RPD50931.1 rhodanese-like domain-containing protein [Paracnuella aquatica]